MSRHLGRVAFYMRRCSVFTSRSVLYIFCLKEKKEQVATRALHMFCMILENLAGLTEVIIYSSPDDKKKNRGFCFLEYESHKSASLAKRRLSTGRIKVWGCDIIVDWADPQEEPDEQTMSKVSLPPAGLFVIFLDRWPEICLGFQVRVLYVRNLTQDCSEEKLKESFEMFGKIDRVKKIKDYAFIHFEDRDNAVKVRLPSCCCCCCCCCCWNRDSV